MQEFAGDPTPSPPVPDGAAEDDLRLAEPSVNAPEAARLSSEAQAVKAFILANDDDDRSFSLSGLLLLVTLAGIMLGIGTRLAPPVFAGVAGAAALLSMVFLAAYRERWVLGQVAWWMLLGIYLIAMARAAWL